MNNTNEAVLREICDMQEKNYGDGVETHVALIDLAKRGRAALAATATVAKDGGDVRRFEFTPYGMVESNTGVYCFFSSATPHPEASSEQSAGEAEPYAFLVTRHDGRVMGTYFDRDGAEYWAKYYGNARKIVPLYLAAPISEDTGKGERAIDALDGMGFTYDREIGWLPPADSSSAAPTVPGEPT